MISNLMQKKISGGSAIRAMFEQGNKLAEQYGRENVYDFSLGNPNFPAPLSLQQSIHDEIDNTDSLYLHGYMPNSGYPEVRQAIADNLNRRYSTHFSAENLIMTVGAAGALNVVFKSILNPGDEIIVIPPYFLEYGNYVENFGGQLVPVPADEETFLPNPEHIRGAIGPKTKAVLLNNPNNPTGVVYGAETISAIAAMLTEEAKRLGHPILIVSDEPYRELCYDGESAPFIPTLYANTVVCYSWSKSLSLPGERIGYVLIPSECEESSELISACTTANRILGFVNAPSLLQRAIVRCQDDWTDAVNFYDGNRRLLYDGLTSLGFECVYPKGAFYLWMKTPCDEKEFIQQALERRVLLVAGSSFGAPGYVRIAYCVSPDTIRRSLPSFRELAELYIH